MDFFFNPKAMAVGGATPNPFKGGDTPSLKLCAPVMGDGSIRSIPAMKKLRVYPVILLSA